MRRVPRGINRHPDRIPTSVETRSATDSAEVLVITGSMGAGKTTVMAEASDLLSAAGVSHAAIDLDALAIIRTPGTEPARISTNCGTPCSTRTSRSAA